MQKAVNLLTLVIALTIAAITGAALVYGTGDKMQTGKALIADGYPDAAQAVAYTDFYPIIFIILAFSIFTLIMLIRARIRYI